MARARVLNGGVTNTSRSAAWLVMLDQYVCPDDREFVDHERKEIYLDLCDAARFVSCVSEDTSDLMDIVRPASAANPDSLSAVTSSPLPKPPLLEDLAVVWRATDTYLHCMAHEAPPENFDWADDVYDGIDLRKLTVIFGSVFPQPYEAFWCLCAFIKSQPQGFHHSSAGNYHKVNMFSRLLHAHVPRASKHFQHLNIGIEDFAFPWFRSFLLGPLCLKHAILVMDRVIASHSDLIVFISVVLVRMLASRICAIMTSSDLMAFLTCPLPNTNIDTVIDQARCMFKDHCIVRSPTLPTVQRHDLCDRCSATG